MFVDRREAGKLLTAKLKEIGCQFDVILAVPRGGIVVADEIATGFQCELDVILARKIGSPDLPEYAVGAVTPDGEVLIHEKVRKLMNIKEDKLHQLTVSVQREINNRLNLYRNYRLPVHIRNRKVLIVDDGIATGFTMKAAIKYLRRENVSEIIMAVPVTSRAAYSSLSHEVDHLVVLLMPDEFLAVGQFYQNFAAVEDDEVIAILKKTLEYRETEL
ncbi:MAG: phosphoribosyltransferase family protein [Syntrophomonas sp.]